MAIPEKNHQGSAASKEALPEIKRLEIEELKKKVEKLEARLEKEWLPEKKEEVVKQEIKGYLLEMQQTSPTALPLADRDEVDEIKKFPPSQQIGALISLVFEKGLSEAVSVAKNLNNPAILDEFHDILIDRYYEELIKKKIVKS